MHRWKTFATAVAIGSLTFGPVAVTSAQAATPLGQVKNLHESTPAPTDTSIDVGWNKVTGADGYELIVTVASSGNVIDDAGVTGTHFKATNVDPGTAYIFEVRAESASAPVGPFSNQLTISTTGQSCAPAMAQQARPAIVQQPGDLPTPGQVKNLHESTPAPTDTTIDIGWNKVTNAVAYQVDITIGNSTTGQDTTATHYHATGLPPGTPISFEIIAKNGQIAGAGPASNTLTITTPGQACQTK